MANKFKEMSSDERDIAIRDLKFQRRFWAKIYITGVGARDCWVWTASNGNGYGHIRVGGSMVSAHRVAYMLMHGPIPDGMMIDHRCGNPACVRASHLRVVTNQQNGQHRTGLDANNTSGYRGVTWHKQAQKWVAKARLDGKHVYLGLFDDLDEAGQVAAAYRSEHYTHDDYQGWAAH